MENIEKVVSETIEKSLPEIVDAVTEKKISDLMVKSNVELDNIKAELKKLSAGQKTAWKVGEAFKQTAMVAIVKEVFQNNVTTEQGFKEVADRHFKEMNEWTATEWQEFVFDQFERDILRVINDFNVVNAVKMYTLAKGDKITFPKAVQWITTTFKWEGADYGTPSKPVTSEIVIDIAKATTMTSMTEELLDDTMTTPDLYNLIVEFIGESQAEFLEDKILNGTIWTNSTIEWLLVNSDVNEVVLAATKTVGDIDDDTLVEAIMKIARKFKRRASNMKWVMSQYTIGKLMQLKTTDGSFLYPSLREATPRLWGYEVVLSDKAPVQDATEDIADATSILFGDLQYFTLVRRKWVTLERGYRDGDWQADIQSVKSNTRVWGKVSFGEAFVKITNGAASW